MKRRGCKECHLIEESPGQWKNGLCPRCSPAAETKEPIKRPADATATRLRKFIAEESVVNPEIWKTVDQWRAARTWPDWCFVPVCTLLAAAQAAAHLSGILDREQPIPPEMAANIHMLAMLAGWRVTQGIYRFDATIAAALRDTPVTGDLPIAVLYAMPEWCVYIETPGWQIRNKALSGFFAHLDYVNEREHHLRLGLDIQDGALEILPLALRGSLPESIADMERDHQSYVEKYGSDPYISAARQTCTYGAADLAPLISLLLYLCSTNAEMRGRTEGQRPWRVRPKQTKSGLRFFPPDKPGLWDVGFRLGAAIRHAMEAERSKPGDGTHASPRAHIRRAHWHSFWTGPKATVIVKGDRKLVLKWLPPIPVNVDEAHEPVPTIHPVRS